MKNKKSNIILLIIFLIVLYAPTISFFFLKDKVNNDNTENRKLASKPELTFEKIQEYPKKYDAYYNDNLPWRNSLVSLWRNINFKLFNESIDDRVLIGHDKNNNTWLFYDNIQEKDEISYIDGRKKANDQIVLDVANKMKKQTKLLEKQNIKLHYVVAPNKSSVYSEYLPQNIEIHEDFFLNTSKKIKDAGVDNLYYDLELLQGDKDYETYYRTDTHWNEYGAYKYTKSFLTEIYKKDVISDAEITQKIVKSEKMDLYNFAGFDFEVDETETVIKFDEEKDIRGSTVKTQYGNVEVYENRTYKIDETIVLMGDSFTTRALEYFYSSFKKVIRIFLNVCDYNQAILDEYKPNRIFYLIVERGTPDTLNMEFIKE